MLPSESATQVVNNRQGSYGHPGPIMEIHASFLTAMLQHKLRPGEVVTPIEATHSMILHKIARDLTMVTPHPDHLVDIAGYANVVQMVRDYLKGDSSAQA